MTTLTVDGWAMQKVELSAANQFVPDVFIANANDASGRGIDLYVTDKDGAALSMSGMKVYLAWRHENGNQDLTPFTAVDASSGHYKVYFPNAMMHSGNVLARIAIYVGASTPVTGSRDFKIHVERNPINEDEAMADESFTTFKRTVFADLESLKANAQSATNAANGAASNANAAASSALQIANAVAQGAAGDSDIAELRGQVSSLGSMVADLRGEFYHLDGCVYAPASKASVSGGAVTLASTCSASGTAITLA